jgi:hypothetical protein
MQSDCDDIRITDANGKLLPHWIEENNPGCNAITDTKVWVKASSLPTSGATLYVYYGNPSAASSQAPENVFEFFDDFNDGTLNTNKWSYTGAYSISGGAITITTGSVYTNNTVVPSAVNYVYEYFNKWTTTSGTYSGLEIANAQSTSGGNSTSKALVYFMSSSDADLNIKGYAADGTVASYNIAGGGTQYTATQNTYYVNGFSIDSTNIRYYNNRSQTNPYTGTWSAAPYLWLGSFTGASGSTDIKDMTTDWVLVRKYASTTPSASLGTEETGKAPVAYWSFNEGSGSTVYDSSSNQYNGTFSGNPAWKNESDCVSGKCLYFNGGTSSDRVNVTLPNYSQLTKNITISFWYKPTNDDDSWDGILNINSGYSGGTRFLVRKDNSTNRIDWQANYGDATPRSTDTGASLLQMGEWHFITATYDGATAKIYLDGKFVSSYNETRDITLTSSLQIGYAQFPFQGFIDEVKIYPYARSAAEIKADFNARGTPKGVSLSTQGDSLKNLSDGLVGYWNFDVGTGTSAPDLSGNSNTANFGTGSSAPGWVAGNYGIGVSFDGNDYINIGNSAPLNNLTNMTISAWINPNAFSASYRSGIVSRRGATGGLNFDLSGSSEAGGAGKIEVMEAGGNFVQGATTLTTGNWYYVTAVMEGNTVKLYLNGSLDGSGTLSWTWDSSTPIYFGNINNINYYWFNGKIDEVRIYNRALSPAEVRELYDWAPGPVAYYDFEEAAGTNVYDKSGYGIGGTWNGTGTHWTNGKYGKAGSFNGGNDYVDMGDVNSVEGLSAMTLSAWIYPKAIDATDRRIVAKENSWYFYASNTFGANQIKYVTHGNSGSDENVTLNATVSLNKWVYATVIYSNGNTSLYIDGVLKDTASNVAMPTSNYQLSIGAKSVDGGVFQEFFNGFIDDVKIYNYARTPKQIVEDMNAGHPAGGSPVGSMLGYWKFDEGYGTTAQNSGFGGSVLNGSFGTGSSAPTWTNNGKFGKALSFGGNDYVTVTDPSDGSLDIRTGSMSWSLWIKSTRASYSSIETLIDKLSWSPTINYKIDILGATTLRVRIGDGTNDTGNQTFTTPSTIYDSNWHHVVVTLDRSLGQLKTYFDGKQAGSTVSVTLTADGNNSTRFGISAYSGEYFQGLIDEVKIYNYALNADEVAIDYNRGSALMLGSKSVGAGNTAPANASSQKYCVPGDTASCAPPVAEWNFSENTGSTAYDTSGNNNNGSLGSGNSAPSWSVGPDGSPALKFDGNDHITTGSSSILNGKSSATISFWAKNNALKTSSYVIWASKTTLIELGCSSGFSGDENDVRVRWNLNGNWANSHVAQNAIEASKWTHWTFSFSGGTTKIYKNGSEIYSGSDSQTTITNVSSSFQFSFRSGTANSGFNGLLDQIRIYDYARSPAQIAWDYNKGAPVAHWKFNECQGTTTNDSSGNGLVGTINIGASAPQTSVGTCSTADTAWGNGASGKYGASLNFDGVDDYVEVNEYNSPNPLDNNLTVSAWIFPKSSPGTWIRAINKAHDTNNGFQIARGGGENAIYFVIFKNGTRYQLGNNGFANNNWYHVVGSWDAQTNTQKLYVNGIERNNNAAGSAGLGSASNLLFGKRGDDVGFFHGQIDEVKIWNYALTAEQVKSEYNGGAVRFAD